LLLEGSNPGRVVIDDGNVAMWIAGHRLLDRNRFNLDQQIGERQPRYAQ
jgi:hypothetical protein